MEKKGTTATITISNNCFNVIKKFSDSKKITFSQGVEYLATIGCGTIVEALKASSEAAKKAENTDTGKKEEPKLKVEK